MVGLPYRAVVAAASARSSDKRWPCPGVDQFAEPAAMAAGPLPAPPRPEGLPPDARVEPPGQLLAGGERSRLFQAPQKPRPTGLPVSRATALHPSADWPSAAGPSPPRLTGTEPPAGHQRQPWSAPGQSGRFAKHSTWSNPKKRNPQWGGQIATRNTCHQRKGCGHGAVGPGSLSTMRYSAARSRCIKNFPAASRRQIDPHGRPLRQFRQPLRPCWASPRVSQPGCVAGRAAGPGTVPSRPCSQSTIGAAI